MADMNTYHPGNLATEKDHADSDPALEAGDGVEADFPGQPAVDDVFGREDGHDIKYKTLSWQMVALLMIAEIVSNGTLSLPSSLAVVGAVPGVVVIVFLGCFATYTSWVLVQFKLRHPEVHSMGDAGYILFGPIGREVLSAGTILFAVFGTGSEILAGQLALGVLSDNRLCLLIYAGICAIITALFSFPRTLDRLTWLGLLAVVCILVAGILGMAGAGAAPTDAGDVAVAVASDFTTAFISITNPVFAFAGHFMFFGFISEMARPQDAMKAAWALQIFGTTFYTVFAIVTYYYLGAGVKSPSLLSLSPIWSKISFGFAFPNFLIAGALYSHTAAKLIFVRIFRNGKHLHSHTVTGWGVWVFLILLANGAAFVLSVGIPIFNYILGITASLLAAWYTYGLAGAFWLHDTYHDKGGIKAWVKRPAMTTFSFVIILAGAFICVAGLYATIQGIKIAYETGMVPPAFTC